MKYENRTIPEGINVTSEHPLKEFFILTVGLGFITFLVVLILSVSAGMLAQLIPFSVEKTLSISAFSGKNSPDNHLDKQQQDIQDYLQNLSSQLATAQQLPKEMQITIHYVDGDTINAFATLGGNIVMYRGLIEKLPHENALAMLMAHEIAHIKQRAPLVSLGRGVTVGLALASITGLGDSGLSQQLVGNISLLTSLTFSRSQEEQADLEALKTVEAYYGHVAGTEALFEILQESSHSSTPPKLFSTHPLTEERINHIKAYAKDNPGNHSFQPLPEAILLLHKQPPASP